MTPETRETIDREMRQRHAAEPAGEWELFDIGGAPIRLGRYMGTGFPRRYIVIYPESTSVVTVFRSTGNQFKVEAGGKVVDIK